MPVMQFRFQLTVPGGLPSSLASLAALSSRSRKLRLAAGRVIALLVHRGRGGRRRQTTVLLREDEILGARRRGQHKQAANGWRFLKTNVTLLSASTRDDPSKVFPAAWYITPPVLRCPPFPPLLCLQQDPSSTAAKKGQQTQAQNIDDLPFPRAPYSVRSE